MFNRKTRENSEYKLLISNLIEKLEDGEIRFAITRFPFKQLCLNGFHTPDISETLLSDYGISTGNKEIEADFFEEVELIEKLLVESATFEAPCVKSRMLAMELWDWYAVPWRYKNNMIYTICSPRDIAGAPIIHEYDVNLFLFKLVSIQIIHAKNHQSRWNDLKNILTLIIFLLTAGYLLNFLYKL